MTIDWSFVWTPQFFIGTVISGLLLNVVGAYAVRALDYVMQTYPAFCRRTRAQESVRIDQLTTAAMADNALYAALAAEGARLRLHQLLNFFIAFVCVCTLVLLARTEELNQDVGLAGILVIMFLIGFTGMQYSLGMDSGRRARRLDIALRVVQKNRNLPVMD